MPSHKSLLRGLISLALAEGVLAQAPIWGQCGGEGWSGDSNCVDGAFCSSYNPWYFQCLPGTATTTIDPSTSTTSGPATTTATVTETSTTTTSSPTSTSVPGTKYLINFGDSYSSTGFWYGGTKPSASNPIGNPTFPGSTWTGGINWVGQIVTTLNTTLTLAYNFAEGGAVTDSDLVTPYSNSLQNYDDQVASFVTNLGSKPDYAPWTADNTVATVWIGVNDIGQPFFSSITPPLSAVLDRYFDLLQMVYDAGVRNFRILSVPPFDKTPLMKQQSSTNLATLVTLISDYNDGVSSRLAAFKSHNSGIISAEIVDTAPAFDEPIDNPTTYGAPDNLCANSDGTSCLWADTYHPGREIERLVAVAVANSLTGNFF